MKRRDHASPHATLGGNTKISPASLPYHRSRALLDNIEYLKTNRLKLSHRGHARCIHGPLHHLFFTPGNTIGEVYFLGKNLSETIHQNAQTLLEVDKTLLTIVFVSNGKAIYRLLRGII